VGCTDDQNRKWLAGSKQHHKRKRYLNINTGVFSSTLTCEGRIFRKVAQFLSNPSNIKSKTVDNSKHHITTYLQTNQRPNLSMANLTTILDADKFPPIFDTLTAHLPIKDVIALTRTCRTLKPLYQKMISNGA
jgi:hypothetical protein